MSFDTRVNTKGHRALLTGTGEEEPRLLRFNAAPKRRQRYAGFTGDLIVQV